MIGRLIDAALERFTEWACSRHGATLDAKTVKEHDDGKHVIGYTIPDYVTGEPYITRVMLPTLFGGWRVFLHRIHRADHDRDLHDHPWSWAFSLILRGSYDEERPVDCHHHDCHETETRRVRWFNFIRGTDVHRITELHGNVWTLFVHGPRHGRGWGFREWQGDSDFGRYEITPSDEYISRRKIERMMSGPAHYYEDPTFDVHVMTGDDLDRWGDVLNCPRKVGEGDPPAREFVPEPDDEYRERLIERIRGAYKGAES